MTEEQKNMIRLKLDDLWEDFDCGFIDSEQLFTKTWELFSKELDNAYKN